MATDAQVSEALAIAYEAGFRGLGLVYAVAIAIRESGLRRDARCFNYRDPATGRVKCSPVWKPGVTSVDRGWWQINSVAHPTVSDAEADDPRAAARHAYRISSGGTNFRAWVAFTTGAFRDALAQVARVAKVDVGELPPLGQKYAPTAPSAGAGRPSTAPTVPGASNPYEVVPAGGIGGLIGAFGGPFADLLGGAGGLGGAVLGSLFGAPTAVGEKVANAVMTGVLRLTIMGALLLGGVALIVIGAWRAVAPTRERINARADEAKQLVVGALAKGAA